MPNLQDEENSPLVIKRRRFLSWAVGVLGAFVGAAVGIPLVGYAISPALSSEGKPWSDAGLLSDLTVGQPTKVEYVIQRKDGWIQTTSQRSAWVLRQADGSLIAYDPRCTHLGCPYSWDLTTQRFLCPCHNGVFALNGTVISGPPPHALDRFQARVDNGRLMILEEAPSAG